MTAKKRSFLAGAALLGVSGLLVKLIGAFYRIPLTHIIGDEGLGLYQLAYPIYSTLLVLSTAGLPTAISKLVSEHMARGETDQARRVFAVSLYLLLAAGAVMTAVLLLFGGPIATAVGDPLARLSMMAIAPSLFFVAALSAFRGYFQGMQNMAPTAVSQLVEQVGKLLVGFTLASRLMPYGVEYGAAGAVLGVTASELAALALVMGMYARHRRTADAESRRRIRKEAAVSVLKRLLPIAIPVMLGACIMPMVGLVDELLVMNRLQDIGYTVEHSRSLYGILTGAVNTLVNMPSVISMALCMSLVPAIAEARARGDQAAVQQRMSLGLKLAVLIGLPAAVGMGLLAKPIIELLYGAAFTEQKVEIAAHLLTAMSAAVFFLTVVQTLNGILQGLGQVMVPVLSLGVGAVLKIIINYALVGNPAINIYGAPVGTVACYLVASLINLCMLGRATAVRWNWGKLFGPPCLAALGMGVVVWGMDALLLESLGPKAVALLGVAAGAVVYGVLLLLTGAIGKEELAYLPGGSKLKRFIRDKRGKHQA